MKAALIGLPKTGTRTLFRLLTGAGKKNDTMPAQGVMTVRDPRLSALAEVYRPKKITPASIEIMCAADITDDYIQGGHIAGDLLESDVVCHVVRAFHNETVYHRDGSVDPLRDVRSIEEELMLHDLVFIEKRYERMNNEKRKGVDHGPERDVLERIQGVLNDGNPLRGVALGDEEKKSIAGYPFLTRKPMVIVFNTDETSSAADSIPAALSAYCAERLLHVMPVSAVIEEEIAALAAEERAPFLKELGIKEPAIDRLTRVIYRALKCISFFTAGPKEIRAWTITDGATARDAAGVIHSDMARGFIRAEVISYADLISEGTEAGVRQAGKLLIKGKDYRISDGDILHIRFNV